MCVPPTLQDRQTGKEKMFDPNKVAENKNKKKAKKNAIKQVKGWITEIIPMDQQTGLIANVEEVQCGDPVSSFLFFVVLFVHFFFLSFFVCLLLVR